MNSNPLHRKTSRLSRLFLYVLCILCCVQPLLLSGCSKTESSSAGKSFCYSLSQEPQTLDPQIAQGEDAFTVILALYEGLARIAEDGSASPGVAERWEHNETYTEWTFYLREDAVWSNSEKTPVTAADFVFAFQRALNPATGSETCSPLYCIENARQIREGTLPVSELGVLAKEERVLVVRLSSPCETFPSLTALPVAMPCNQEFFESTSGRYGLEKSQILGNGPFVIDGRYGWEAGAHINVKTSSSYHGEASPLPSDLSFVFSQKELDVSDPLKALTSGSVDAISLNMDQAQQAEEAGCTIVSFEDSTWGLRFNLQHESLKNEALRTFFARSLDWNQLTESSYLPSGASSAKGVIPPSISWNGNSYRSAAGTLSLPSLLSEEELSDLLQTGLRELSLTDAPVFTVLCPEDEAVKSMVNEMLKTWNQLTGLYYNMEPLPEDELQSRIRTGQYAAAICRISPESDSLYSALSEFQSCSSEYSDLLEHLSQSGGEEAIELARQAEAFLPEHCIFLPLYTGSQYYGMAAGVSGIHFFPYGGGVDFFSAGKD